MEHLGRKIASLLVIGLISVALIGCGENAELWDLQNALNQGIQDINTLDAVDETDLSEQDIEDVNLVLTEGSTIELSLTLLEEPLTIQEKIDLIQATHANIRATQLEINTKKAELKIAVEELKVDIQAFRNGDATLSDEDKALIKTYIEEIVSIRNDLKATIGQAYRKMADLRGKFRLANVDLILTTFQDVEQVLALRLEKITRLSEIVVSLNAII